MPLAREDIADFIKANPRPICPACLTSALRMPFDRVMDGLSDIQLRRDFPIRLGQCSVCGRKNQMVIEPRTT